MIKEHTALSPNQFGRHNQVLPSSTLKLLENVGGWKTEKEFSQEEKGKQNYYLNKVLFTIQVTVQ